MKKNTVSTYQITPSELYYAEGDTSRVVRQFTHNGYAVSDKVTAYKNFDSWRLVHNATGIAYHNSLNKVMGNEAAAAEMAVKLIAKVEDAKKNGYTQGYTNVEFLTLDDYMRYVEAGYTGNIAALVKLERERLTGLIAKYEARTLQAAQSVVEAAAIYAEDVKKRVTSGQYAYDFNRRYDVETASKALITHRANLAKLEAVHADILKAAEEVKPEVSADRYDIAAQNADGTMTVIASVGHHDIDEAPEAAAPVAIAEEAATGATFTEQPTTAPETEMERVAKALQALNLTVYAKGIRLWTDGENAANKATLLELGMKYAPTQKAWYSVATAATSEENKAAFEALTAGEQPAAAPNAERKAA